MGISTEYGEGARGCITMYVGYKQMMIYIYDTESPQPYPFAIPIPFILVHTELNYPGRVGKLVTSQNLPTSFEVLWQGNYIY